MNHYKDATKNYYPVLYWPTT